MNPARLFDLLLGAAIVAFAALLVLGVAR